MNAIKPHELVERALEISRADGCVVIADEDSSANLRWAGNGYRVVVKDGPAVCYQRPSVDVMFQSIVGAARGPVIAALLTGMGADGAQGMVSLRRAGAQTIAQDEQSCVVFGMPKEAIRLDGAEQVLSLLKMPGAMLAALKRAPVLARS